ncbi:glycosyltransferase [Moellerella wisconsensis]|uniref:Glycosyltransferase n=1 Tax=Moellerella wisconsensis TaxID=158849 RepID=A0ACD3Y4Z5_9GAMM|nr:glycosyltransferase [Moellerella wisconsensis]UNH38218.1 glycosyltransferase [Moellerella wisconsensis]
MKILFIITGLGMGGAEKIVSNLADLYNNKNHSITIISLKDPILVKPESENINIINLHVKGTFEFIKSIFTLKSIIKKLKPDVVHSHMFHAIIASRICRLLVRIPKLICSAHNTVDGSIFRSFIYRITDFLSDMTTNVSPDAVNSFIKSHAVPKNKITCIYNGIDIKRFKKTITEKSINEFIDLQGKNIFLSVGSLTKQKDYPNLFKALSLYQQENGSNFKLLIVGDGPLKQSLINLSNQLGLQNNILFLGLRHDIPELMSICNLFILPSAWEGFGLVVAEAMACESLVIGTDCGGVKDVINQYGIIIPPKDHNALKLAISHAVNLAPIEKETIQKNARRYIINNYSIEKMANSYLTLYLK